MSEVENKDYITETKLAGVYIIERPVFGDSRGFFRETYRTGDLENKLGSQFLPKQANHSRSKKDSLRGIHVAPWHKLVTCTSGLVQQIVVDTRIQSPTFGQYVSIIMGEDNWRSVFVPEGCGNAYLVLSDIADYTYLATDYWSPGLEKEVLWNDPDINIVWQTQSPSVSERDSNALPLKEVFPKTN